MSSMTRKPLTFRRALASGLANAFMLVSLGTAAVVLPGLGAEAGANLGAAENLGRPPVAGSPSALVEKHDCWTGEAPADMQGVVPGHVVVTKGLAPVYGGSKLVGQALEQIFEGVDHGLTVHGFCR